MFRNNVFVLGAGFSANAGAPVMRDFIERAKRLRDDARLNLPTEDRKTFGNVFQRLSELRVSQAKMAVDLENIEHLFSLLDMDIEFGGISKRSLRQELIFLILRTLERTIQTANLPSRWNTLNMKGPGESNNVQKNIFTNYVELFSALASRRWISGPLGIPTDGNCPDAIITMNYDCLVDDCLVRLGVQPEYKIENAEIPGEIIRAPYRLRMLKLHGSANWFQCNSEQCKGRIRTAGGTASQRLEYFYGQTCRNCGRQQVEPVIVPPTWAKGGQSEVLRPVWCEALRALQQAGRIIIIGYSMPPTDEFFRYMLALALATNEKLDKVIVVNPSDNAQETFAKLFLPQFADRRLVSKKLVAAEYVYELGNELGQFGHGFEAGMVSSSGFKIG